MAIDLRGLELAMTAIIMPLGTGSELVSFIDPNGGAIMEAEVRELLTEELKDAYSAEKQALRCMQKALRKASADALREGIQLHIEQTQVQIERIEQAMEKLGVRPGRKVCEAMRGLVEEAQHEIEEHEEKGPILDLV